MDWNPEALLKYKGLTWKPREFIESHNSAHMCPELTIKFIGFREPPDWTKHQPKEEPTDEPLTHRLPS